MTISEAEKIAREFGLFVSNQKESLPVLADGTTYEQYFEDNRLTPYYSIRDLPHSPARIKYAILCWAEHAVKNGYMDYLSYGSPRWKTVTSTPIGNLLQRVYGFLSDFIDDAYKINQVRADIMKIQDESRMKVSIIKFESKYKIDFDGPDFLHQEAEFVEFLNDLNGKWND